MEILSSNLIFIIAGICVVIYLYVTYMTGGVPKQFRTPLHLFTKRKQVFRIEAETRGGLMFPDKRPGYVEIEAAVITKRSGRVWKSWGGQEAIEAGRKREVIYVVRENDPTPLTIGLGAAGGYQGQQIDNETFEDLSNLNQRAAASDAQIDGASKDLVASRMTIALIIGVTGAVLAWGGVFALTVIHGDPTV